MPLEPIVLCRLIIVAVFQNATEEYSCLSVCLCVCVCLSVCLSQCVSVYTIIWVNQLETLTYCSI